MNQNLLVTFNPGSSTIKLGLFADANSKPRRIGGGMIDLRAAPLMLHISEGPKRTDIELKSALQEDLHDLISETLESLVEHFASDHFIGAGHRVVHGGDRFSGPARIDDQVLAAIAALRHLAPLHQPRAVRLIESIRRIWPDVPQIASFDTAFHRTQTDTERRIALPRELFGEGVKRYGFHGLSYKFIAGALAREAPEIAAGRVVVAHLGSGASLCALEGGISRSASMGFSTLDGIPMATRSGAIDPGILLYLLQERRLAVADLEDMLYHRSGLLGLSGISADARVLTESEEPAAAEAMAIFALAIARQVAAYAATLKGLDGLVFTAGIGEHQPALRAAVCDHLGWAGIDIDAQSNVFNETRISTRTSGVAVFVLPTDEESVIAEEAASILASG
ncbi:acetate kinase [Kaistia algarum]|uniref:acetate/propionate family kinase n=1 Tax=Kaistia algarum TaxID=2083279 RepID=UPI000CE8EAF1|nr:acetate/propionate family kinase [Kaistia algarum]MCX5514648.1 acetate/propionate family kinase [Kaistia algarum]PPE78919.1 acetate kinase [Kaistia algarum]